MNLGMIKLALGLLFVMSLILATNLIDKRNFNQVGYAIESIYEDRLVAKDLIFDISVLINEKAMALALSDSIFYNDKNFNVNQKIDELIDLFSDTKLTAEEKQVFKNLKEDVLLLERLEVGSTSSDHQGQFFTNNEVHELLMNIQNKLHALSKIQIEEGKRLLLVGKTAVRSVDFLTKIEVYLLIALAIVVQLLFISGLKFGKRRKGQETDDVGFS